MYINYKPVFLTWFLQTYGKLVDMHFKVASEFVHKT